MIAYCYIRQSRSQTLKERQVISINNYKKEGRIICIMIRPLGRCLSNLLSLSRNQVGIMVYLANGKGLLNVEPGTLLVRHPFLDQCI